MTIANIIDPVEKLTKEERAAASDLAASEARYLVNAYYTMQEHRMATGNQVRSLFESGEPNGAIRFFHKQYAQTEKNIQRILDVYTLEHPVGAWMRGIKGVGPVIAAGLLAHIDIHQAPTVGHIWSFAGLDPNVTWWGRKKAEEHVQNVMGDTRKVTQEHVRCLAERAGRKPENIVRIATGGGEKKLTRSNLTAALAKRPWNAKLKTICWKLGEAFVKVQNYPDDIYGHVYAERKLLELARNEEQMFADQAKQILRERNIGKDTEAYKWYSRGMLPPAHIHARAKRYAVKLFLSHLHEFWYEYEFQETPPLPYPIAFQGHTHKIPRP